METTLFRLYGVVQVGSSLIPFVSIDDDCIPAGASLSIGADRDGDMVFVTPTPDVFDDDRPAVRLFVSCRAQSM